MTTPSERRDRVQVLVRRGISQRKALGYLGLSRRIASYAPRQTGKDRVVAERLLAASPKVPRFGHRRGLAGPGRGPGAASVAPAGLEHPTSPAAPPPVWQRYPPAGRHAPERRLELRLRP